MEVMPAEPFLLKESVGFRCGIHGGQAKTPPSGRGGVLRPAATPGEETRLRVRPSNSLARSSTTLADFSAGTGFPNHFFCDSWVVGFLEGPTMVSRTSDWRDELGRWLKPFLDRLGHKA